MLSNFRHHRRRRISIGPQSEADARELLANRQQTRRNRAASSPRRKEKTQVQPASGPNADLPSRISESAGGPLSNSTPDLRRTNVSRSSLHVTPPRKSLLTPPASDAGASSDSGREDEKERREMFSMLEKPRTRYDVEVITKLVVYSGMFGFQDCSGDSNTMLRHRLACCRRQSAHVRSSGFDMSAKFLLHSLATLH